MFKIKWILFLLVCVGFAGCKTANIPEPYNFKVKELQKNPFGCWMEVSVDSSTAAILDIITVSGELLNISHDSVFLLVADGKIQSIKNRSILTSKLYTHKNQSGTYLLMTGLYIIPGIIGAIANPDYAGEFMLMTIPVSIVGIFQSVKDGASKRNILVYPKKNSLDDFKPFARFPAGLPENMNLNLLYLKKM
jgi:hypothetical protein